VGAVVKVRYPPAYTAGAWAEGSARPFLLPVLTVFVGAIALIAFAIVAMTE
jgi:hypothetical protein